MNQGVVIPAYNEAATIARVVASVRQIGAVIVVDDCSSDGTAERAAGAGAVVVRHRYNRGYDAALQSGFQQAEELGLEAVATFDADGQHDAAVLHRILEPLCNGSVELVLGIRPNAARVSEYLFNVYGRHRFGVDDLLCGLKGYRMSLYRRHGRFDGTRSIGTELALAGLRMGVPLCTVQVPIHAREGNPRFGSVISSNRGILRALVLAIWADITYSVNQANTT